MEKREDIAGVAKSLPAIQRLPSQLNLDDVMPKNPASCIEYYIDDEKVSRIEAFFNQRIREIWEIRATGIRYYKPFVEIFRPVMDLLRDPERFRDPWIQSFFNSFLQFYVNSLPYFQEGQGGTLLYQADTLERGLWNLFLQEYQARVLEFRMEKTLHKRLGFDDDEIALHLKTEHEYAARKRYEWLRRSLEFMDSIREQLKVEVDKLRERERYARIERLAELRIQEKTAVPAREERKP